MRRRVRGEARGATTATCRSCMHRPPSHPATTLQHATAHPATLLLLRRSPMSTLCWTARSMSPGTKVFWGEPLMNGTPSSTHATAYRVEGDTSARGMGGGCEGGGGEVMQAGVGSVAQVGLEMNGGREEHCRWARST